VHFISDNDVCPYCGSLSSCDCEAGDEWSAVSSADNQSSSNSIPMLEDTETDQTQADPQYLELIIVKPLKMNQQVYNTYGQLSNTELLNRYGFIERDNPYSYVAVSREDILSTLGGVDGREVVGVDGREVVGVDGRKVVGVDGREVAGVDGRKVVGVDDGRKEAGVDERIDFWDQVGNDIVQQIEEIDDEADRNEKEHEHGDGCCGDEHEHGDGCCGDDLEVGAHDSGGSCGDEHEHGDGCCGDDKDHCHDDLDQDGNMIDENDEAELEDDEEELEDDFRICKTGPNFALRSFLALLFLSPSEFEKIATNLDMLIPYLMNISKSSFESCCVDSKKVIDRIAKKRLEGYDVYECDDGDESDERVVMAVMLRMEEEQILKGVIKD
jgi:hypothetical protein